MSYLTDQDHKMGATNNINRETNYFTFSVNTSIPNKKDGGAKYT